MVILKIRSIIQHFIFKHINIKFDDLRKYNLDKDYKEQFTNENKQQTRVRIANDVIEVQICLLKKNLPHFLV